LKLINYSRSGQTGIGILKENSVFDVSELAKEAGISQLVSTSSIDYILVNSLLETIQLVEKKLAMTKIEANSLDSVRILSPVLQPEKIYLAGLNYQAHIKEDQKQKAPSEPYFFTKFRNSIVGPGDPIIIPRISKKADWEVELAVIIGRRGKYIKRSEAMSYVAGYTIANDVSFRDLQFPEGWPEKPNTMGQNWVKGKGPDTALPLGPCLVTTNEMNDPYDREISLSVNGILRQKAAIDEMIFKIDQLIEYLSGGITLSPGDIISTGTPAGVAAFSGAPYLKDGDVIVAKIEGIGELQNPVRAEN
jgi:2-keto-4-pentenoate hydratase/2-oxohepta-3-ene-1,7-dioic acid hydratase in catechol pathway